jgi:hypothetical protein
LKGTFRHSCGKELESIMLLEDDKTRVLVISLLAAIGDDSPPVTDGPTKALELFTFGESKIDEKSAIVRESTMLWEADKIRVPVISLLAAIGDVSPSVTDGPTKSVEPARLQEGGSDEESERELESIMLLEEDKTHVPAKSLLHRGGADWETATERPTNADETEKP